ncbi:uncharacterized protein LOC116258375 [Nymphaea colorata]|nr:uncharacterized protein LOC116258375 [Nymphaea colorata]
MDDQKEKNAWMSIPQFGAWDGNGNMPDYSMDFSKIRESRKQNKKDISRASIGNEEELANPQRHDGKNDHKSHDHHHHQQQQQQQIELPMHAPNGSPSRRKKILSCFTCCVSA